MKGIRKTKSQFGIGSLENLTLVKIIKPRVKI